jgi:hypothetical protein
MKKYPHRGSAKEARWIAAKKKLTSFWKGFDLEMSAEGDVEKWKKWLSKK